MAGALQLTRCGYLMAGDLAMISCRHFVHVVVNGVVFYDCRCFGVAFFTLSPYDGSVARPLTKAHGSQVCDGVRLCPTINSGLRALCLVCCRRYSRAMRVVRCTGLYGGKQTKPSLGVRISEGSYHGCGDCFWPHEVVLTISSKKLLFCPHDGIEGQV
jgi:hypothetical protein